MMVLDRAGSIGIYAWCADLDQTPGGIESFVGHLARNLAERGRPVVVHCMAADTAGWHVHDGRFRIGGRIAQVGTRLHAFRPAHGPGVGGAITENMAVSRQFGESVVLAFGTRDGYVFDVAAEVARQRGLPAAAFYYHAADERRFRAQFSTRGAGVPGLASADEHTAFEERTVTALRALGTNFAAVVVPTEYVRGQISTVLPPTDVTKVLVAYHGPDGAVFPPRSLPWDGSGPWLHVSRFSVPNAAHKNFTWSCELIGAAVASGLPLSQRARLEVCGDGNGERLVHDYAFQNGLTDRIAVAGSLDQRSLAARYRKAAFLLVPSMMEAGCTVVVEAVLSGCVPVVLDYAGAGEIMRRLGLSHLLIRPVPRRHPCLLPDGTPTGHVETVEPDMNDALEILTRCLRDPAGTGQAISAAAMIARADLTVAPSVRAIDDGLRRLGVDLGLSPASAPETVTGNDGGKVGEAS